MTDSSDTGVGGREMTTPGKTHEGTAVGGEVLGAVQSKAKRGGLLLCRKCRVPLLVGRLQIWRDNGTIVQRMNKDQRLIFIETENLEIILHKVEEIIGVPIEHMIIESTRRAAFKYLDSVIPSPVIRLGRRVAPRFLIKRIIDIAWAFGYGELELDEFRLKFDDEDYVTETLVNPRSLSQFCGEYLAAFELLYGREGVIEYEETQKDTYCITIRVGKHSRELEDYLELAQYAIKPGDMVFERCSRCNIPLDIASCRWDLERGIIVHPVSMTRMSLYGPMGIEATFRDLEQELGQEVSEAVIDAQKRFTKGAMPESSWEEVDLKYLLALRGLGYLSEMQITKDDFRVVIQNPCVPLMLVGMVKGLFELSVGISDSSHQWRINDEGDLDITISA